MSFKQYAGIYSNVESSSAGYVAERLAQAAIGGGAYTTMANLSGEPDFMVLFAGLIPIPFGVRTGNIFLDSCSVQHFEVARSQDLLQYRAIGAAFMAQQQGAHVGIRIDLELYGPYKELWLTILQGMYLWGRTEMKDNINKDKGFVEPTDTATVNVTKSFTTNNVPSAGPGNVHFVSAKEISGVKNIFNMIFQSNATKISTAKTGSTYSITASSQQKSYENFVPDNVRTRDDIINSSNKYITTDDDESWTQSEYHRTFTLITRTEMLFDMFIETMGHRRSIDNGKDVINVNLLIRNFKPPDIITSTYKQFVQKNAPGTNIGTSEFKSIRIVETKSITDNLLGNKKRWAAMSNLNYVLSSAWRLITGSRMSGFRFSSNSERMKSRRIGGRRLTELIADNNPVKLKSGGNY